MIIVFNQNGHGRNIKVGCVVWAYNISAAPVNSFLVLKAVNNANQY